MSFERLVYVQVSAHVSLVLLQYAVDHLAEHRTGVIAGGVLDSQDCIVTPMGAVVVVPVLIPVGNLLGSYR